MISKITYCPGTLTKGNNTYSRKCLKNVFDGRKVSHILPYESPFSNEITDNLFIENRKRISISGVQEKFSLIQEKNHLRLIIEGEQGTHILKPIPNAAKNADQMPANEHLTMQIASQIFGIETAPNALIFFNDNTPAYITKRFDINQDGTKLAQEDFASLAGRTPQKYGENYKYLGSYLEVFKLVQKYIPACQIESIKLYKTLVFNYLFSNGDAHLKNFSIIETPLGDFKLSPAYDLLNSRIHIEDRDFALEEGLFPKNYIKGNIYNQFLKLAELTDIKKSQIDIVFNLFLSKELDVENLVNSSFLNDRTKRNYLQSYRARLKKLKK